MYYSYTSYYPTIIKMMHNVRLARYVPRDFSRLTDKELLSYFEDTPKFLSLKKSTLNQLFNEVAHRLSVGAKVPDFVVKVNLANNGDKYREETLNNCFSYGHVSSSSPHIEINVLKNPDARFVPPSLINKVGLIYLEAIVHEHRHMQQAYYRAKMLEGYIVPPDMQLMGMDYVVSACAYLTGEYVRDFTDYCLEFQEIDSRLYSYDVFSAWLARNCFKDSLATKSYLDNKINREFGGFVGDKEKAIAKKFQRDRMMLNRRLFDLHYGYSKRITIRDLLDNWEDKYTISIQRQMFNKMEKYFKQITSEITPDMKPIVEVTRKGVTAKQDKQNSIDKKEQEGDYEY